MDSNITISSYKERVHSVIVYLVSCCFKLVCFFSFVEQLKTVFIHIMKVSGVHNFQAPKRVNTGVNFDLSVGKLGIYQ